MPQCPQCQSPYGEGQRFCSQCGASLTGEPPGLTAPPPPRPAPSMPPWVVGLLIASGVIIVILLIMLFSRSAPPPAPAPAPKAEAPAPPAPAPAPVVPAAAPEADLKKQVQSVFNAMREAHLNKNLDQYLNCYSPSFPGLAQKRQDTLRDWENYDFVNVYFAIDDLKPLDADTVSSTVTWNLDTRNRRTQEYVSAKQTYRVRFAREQGAWRIQGLEEVK